MTRDPKEAAVLFGVAAVALASLSGIGRERTAQLLEQCADEIRREVLSTSMNYADAMLEAREG